MIENQGPVASSERRLPLRANLEQLKKQAKDRLSTLHKVTPKAKLADAQFAIAREYGFASWQKLKTHVERYRLPDDQRLVDEMVRAVQRRDMAAVRSLIRQDQALVNARDSNGRSVILIAANAEHHGATSDLVDLLLQHEPILLDLHTAAALGMQDVLANGVNAEATRLDEPDWEGMTPLLWAVHGRHDEAARFLLECGANPNMSEATGWTPLHIVAERGSPVLVQALIVHGGALGTQLQTGERPIHIAAKYGRAQVVDVFLAAGEEIDVWTAAALGQINKLERMRDNIDTPLSGTAQYRPIYFASHAKQEATVAWLLAQGVTPCSQTLKPSPYGDRSTGYNHPS